MLQGTLGDQDHPEVITVMQVVNGVIRLGSAHVPCIGRQEDGIQLSTPLWGLLVGPEAMKNASGNRRLQWAV